MSDLETDRMLVIATEAAPMKGWARLKKSLYKSSDKALKNT